MTVHIAQLAKGGWSTDYGLPGFLVTFFSTLVVVDAVVAVAIAKRSRFGWLSGTVVLTLDAAANAVANYPPIDTTSGLTPGRIGQAVISALALAMIALSPLMLRALPARR